MTVYENDTVVFHDVWHDLDECRRDVTRFLMRRYPLQAARALVPRKERCRDRCARCGFRAPVSPEAVLWVCPRCGHRNGRARAMPVTGNQRA